MNAEIDLSQVYLKTPRLTLRPWKESDADAFYEYAKVDGVGQMAGWKPHESIEESKRVLGFFINEKKTFCIDYEGKAIGSLGVERYDETAFPELEELRCREIGYVISKDYWGKGLMAEAVNEVLRYLFEEVELDAVLCGHAYFNRQSDRVMTKCGFYHAKNVILTTRMGTQEPVEEKIIYASDWRRIHQEEGGLIGTFQDNLWPYEETNHIRLTARALAFNEKNELALLKIEGEDFFGKRNHYETCGGGLEEGETFEETVIREVREELGYGVRETYYLGEIWDFYNIINRETHSHFFFVWLNTEDVKPLERTEEENRLISNVVWLEPQQALKELENSPESNVDIIVQRRDALALKYLLEKHPELLEK